MAKKSQDFSTEAAKWKKRFDIASSNQETLFKQFAKWYDAFNARTTVQTAPWRSKPYMPIIAQQVWALVAKFSSLRPGFEVQLRDSDTLNDEELEQKADIAQKKLEYDYDSPYLDEPMRDKIAAVMIDASVTGTGIAEVNWKTFKKVRRERIVNDQGIVDLTKEKVYESFVGYNDFEPVNIFNVFVAPTAEDLYSAPWIIIRSYTPISELETQNEAKGGKFYQNLDKLSGKPKYGNFYTYNQSRQRMTLQEPTDTTVDTATIYKCYAGEDIYIFGEDKSGESDSGWVLLRKAKNYYWHGKYPLVKFHIKKRPYSFWGQGLAELAYRLQVIYNDIFAHYLDAWNLTNNPSWWAPENADIDDYVIEPGAVIPYRGDTPPVPIQVQEPNPNALQMIIGLIQGQIEGVTASQYATGMTNSATDKTKGTATGIMKLQDAAGDIISYLRENFQTSLVQVGKMWFSNNQQFMDKPMDITVTDKGKRQTLTVGPADIKGEAEIFIDSASMVPESEQEKAQKAQALTSQLLTLQQASVAQQQFAGTEPLYINFSEAADDIGEAFGKHNMQNLLLSKDQVVQAQVETQQADQVAQANVQMGYHPNPDTAVKQMGQELYNQGFLNPETAQQDMTQQDGFVNGQ